MRHPTRSTLFPYTTLFRSRDRVDTAVPGAGAGPRLGDIARLRGDEFMVLLPNMRSPADAGGVAERLIEALHHEFIATEEIGRAHVRTPVTVPDRMPSSA